MGKSVKPKVKKVTATIVRTFQTRLRGDFPELEDMAHRYCVARRTTYGLAKLQSKTFDDFKEVVCQKFDLPSRVFSALSKDLAGKVSGIQEKAKFDLGEVEDRIGQIGKAIAKNNATLVNPKSTKRQKSSARFNLVVKGQSLKRMTARRRRVGHVVTDVYPKLCFGSAKLFSAQNHLAANGFKNHAAWLKVWRSARSDQVQIVGSNDEPSGNKTCRVTEVGEDGAVTLDLFLGKGVGHLTLPPIILPHGHHEWLQAVALADAECEISKNWQAESKDKTEKFLAGLSADLDEKARDAAEKAFRSARLKARRAQQKSGYAISYRFQRDERSWRVLVTITQDAPLATPDYAHGASGLDLNDQHVSRTLVGPRGEFVESVDFPMVTVGFSTGQRRAMLHDLAHALVMEAKAKSVPLVCERLDFSAKKFRLREVGCAAAARRLSSWAYAQFFAILHSHARLHGVAVAVVEPAYTSVIGAALHAVPNGLTIHASAAMTIARRAMRVEELLPDRMRVWIYGRRPRSVERPVCLQRRASVEHNWAGWRELAKAVHAARAMERVTPTTGTMRRRLVRDDKAAAFASEIPF